MQQLTIRTATHLSAQALCSTLAEFRPELTTDDDGRCFVSVEIGTDRHAVEVFATIHEFVDSHPAGMVENSMVFSVDDREYSLRRRTVPGTTKFGSANAGDVAT